MCAKCVLVSLSDWTHVFHRGDESVPFAHNICLLMVCVPSRWPQRHGLRRAIITSLYTLARHVITCLCGWLCTLVWFIRRESHWVVCLSAYIYQNMQVTDTRPNKHANTPKTSEKGSMSRVKVSNMAYQASSLSLCRSSDVREDFLNTRIQTLLDLRSVKLKQIASWKCAVQSPP